MEMPGMPPAETGRAPEKEISLEEKENLLRLWESIVVDCPSPEDPAAMDLGQIKDYLEKSASADAKRLVDEWGLRDEESEDKIRREPDPEKKSALILDYLHSIKSSLDAVKQDREGADSLRRWDGWPKQMRQDRSFNCAGSSLLGMEIIQELGLETYYGSPQGHVADVLRLPDGSWIYADFSNPDQILPLEAEKIRIGDTPALKFRHPGIAYEILPLRPSAEAPEFLLSNLEAVTIEGSDPDACQGSSADNLKSQKLAKEYAFLFQALEIARLRDVFYPDREKLSDSPEMKEENERIDAIRAFMSSFNAAILQTPGLREELSQKSEEMEAFLFAESPTDKGGLTSQAYDFLVRTRQDFEKLQLIHPHAYASLHKMLRLELRRAKKCLI